MASDQQAGKLFAVTEEARSTTASLVAGLTRPSNESPTGFDNFKSYVARKWRTNGTLFLMCLPAIAVLLIYSYIPMYGVIIAFKNFSGFDGIFGSPWVGLDNFKYLFLTDAKKITLNTLSMNAIFIVTGTIASLSVALMLNSIRDSAAGLARFYQAVVFFPFLLSYVIVSFLLYALLNPSTGTIDHLLVSLHFNQFANYNWYYQPQYWPWILTIVNIWKSIGFGTVIYLAGLIALNPEYYDAANIDGANILQRLRYITLPLIRPLIILQVLLAISRILFSDFGLFYIATRQYANPALIQTTDVIDTYVYRALINLNDPGMAAAAALFQSGVGFFIILFANWLVRRIDPESAIY